ncbi:MAG: hypothetical protein GXP17_08050 [Gammaproteobacteria bacterium]|nr:hypothetical protein [Gammaproteobacteria bacterium]
MPGPAARITDMTAHGGVIMPPGVPTVLIGGLPAATITSMHVCPMVTVLVPHVGGPVLPPGVPTVLIGGLPAATVGDMAVCVGPPDVIIPPGCPTVLIGTGGGGSGGGGGGAVQAATASAIAALVGEPGPEAEGPHWIEYQFKDSAGNPVRGVQYEFTGVDGNAENIKPLTGDGIVKRGGIPDEGECSIKLLSVYNAAWSTNEATLGDEVELSADIDGYEDGTPAKFEILQKNIRGADRLIATVESTVDGEKIEASWLYEFDEDDAATVEAGGETTSAEAVQSPPDVIEDEGADDDDAEDNCPEEPMDSLEDDEASAVTPAAEADDADNYSSPEYYFIATVGACDARSDLLQFKRTIEISLINNAGEPVKNAKYKVYFDNGEIQEGSLDADGYKKIEDAPTVAWSVEFPEYQQASDFTEE